LFTPRARDIFSLLPADVGRPLSDINGQIADDDLTENLERVLSSLQPVQYEVQTREGRWYLMNIAPYRTTDDRINGIVLTFVDVTERKRREEETRQLASRLERQTRIFDTTLSSISDFAYLFDRDGRFVYSNRPLLDLLGITLEEIIGKNFFDLKYPDDLAARLQAQIRQVFDTKQIVRDEMPFTSATGADGYYEYIFTPVFAADGATVEVVAGSTRDVTERKQNEIKIRENRERLQRAMDAGRMFSWEMNPETQEFVYSDNAASVIGFDLSAQSIQNPAGNYIHPEDVERAVRITTRAAETGEPYEDTLRSSIPTPAKSCGYTRRAASSPPPMVKGVSSGWRRTSPAQTGGRGIARVGSSFPRHLRAGQRRHRPDVFRRPVFAGQSGLLQIHRYTEAECCGMKVGAISHPDDYKLEESQIKRLMGG
jgi:PAS domain S-box-containing protein